MRLLGNVFIVIGVLMCLTWFLLPVGLPSVGVGALLRLAAGRRGRPAV